ncbi:MAG: tyrosine-type recombinase/integrase [Firmicutes bacterium]|nr:tyrosine-type recombinase/integrase [Bacillota bacterium]
MGKDLRGKELGEGISQRKDGRYSARYRDVAGRRREKYFNKASEAREWLINSRYVNLHGSIVAGEEMTVNAWFEYWINNVKINTTKRNTVKNYKQRYTQNIKDYIGNMIITQVKPLHLQQIINTMASEGYAVSTIQQTRLLMANFFNAAVDNDIIRNSPLKRTVVLPKKQKKERRVLTLSEQTAFLEGAQSYDNFPVFVFALQTGMRAGEVIGLQFKDIDFGRRYINVNQSCEYDYKQKEFVCGSPKSESGQRCIPMTDVVFNILNKQREKKATRKIVNLKYADFVFLSKKGVPLKNSSLDEQLAKIARELKIEKFSMHTFRHTFATRCIEAEVNPKTLQTILGHSDISLTLNLYTHTTTEHMKKEMEKLSEIPAMGVKWVSNL